MEITTTYLTLKPKLRYRGVCAIDPPASDFIAYEANLQENWSRLPRPNALWETYWERCGIRIEKLQDIRSGCGIFVVTQQGDAVFATLRGTIYEVAEAVQATAKRYCIEPVYLMETPLPLNRNLPFCAGVISGFLYAFDIVTPIFVAVPSKKEHKNAAWEEFQKAHGFSDYKPTNHEKSALLLYKRVFGFSNSDVTQIKAEVDKVEVYSRCD